MRSLLFLLVVFCVVEAYLIPPPREKNCTVIKGNCDFYLNCVEASVPCGAKGYARDYGYFYCNSYKQHLPTFSEQGKEWVMNVMACLQDALVPVLNSSVLPSCSTLEKDAFNSHANCYEQVGRKGVCSLPMSDFVSIYSVIKKAVFTHPFTTWGALGKILLGTPCIREFLKRFDPHSPLLYIQ